MTQIACVVRAYLMDFADMTVLLPLLKAFEYLITCAWLLALHSMQSQTLVTSCRLVAFMMTPGLLSRQQGRTRGVGRYSLRPQ